MQLCVTRNRYGFAYLLPRSVTVFESSLKPDFWLLLHLVENTTAIIYNSRNAKIYIAAQKDLWRCCYPFLIKDFLSYYTIFYYCTIFILYYLYYTIFYYCTIFYSIILLYTYSIYYLYFIIPSFTFIFIVLCLSYLYIYILSLSYLYIILLIYFIYFICYLIDIFCLIYYFILF